MGVSTREKGVLKLVHPGRHVETHKEPITASEIMKKYPRHCITRPDVFKYPYIVVRPESVLFPGKVFYLLPVRTLYNLLKAREQGNQSFHQEQQLPQKHDRRGQARQQSAIKCWGGMIPKHQGHDRGYRRRLKNILGDRSSSSVQDSEDYNSDTSYMDAWTGIGLKDRKVHNKAYPSDSSFNSSISFCSKGYQSNPKSKTSNVSKIRKGDSFSSSLAIVRIDDVPKRSSRDQGKLKSCLRKKDGARKFLNLTVRFASPIVAPRTAQRPSNY
ncbi:OLC1v1006787C1 [Oldenlandia corymbosa var. corymbosa]|uniref:OLC1v1006787C1 n=1 Tax=Oldenlandia corymbosa var. corymbosa TaxID=529605 RepID=A0AAV1DHS6_OLDCO|nr:OLC1v1006787C1 [Oldenlandia corymbosa var. corymbosa]